ncbi:MAG: glycosyltransferase [Ignavibacteriales bacterium]|nr:glycosyltransferase [Ignavibacteriales bacterium]
MNILLLSNYSIGCVPYYVNRAIEKLGYRVYPFSPDYNSDGWTKIPIDVNINDLINKIDSTVDLVLVVEASTGTKLFPQGLESVVAPTAWWGIDTHLNYRWHKEYANLFDVAFFAQKEYVLKARKYGVKNVSWLPLGCDEEIHGDKNLPRIYDVSFVGNLTQNRKQFFSQIGIPIHLQSNVYLDEMAKIYSQSKIVLNISAREDLNMRAFEAMCSGALLITQRIDAGIHDLFIEGKHFAFHDIYDAEKVIKYYLDNPDERKKIAMAGREEVIKSNKYSDRVKRIIELVNEKQFSINERQRKFASYKIFVQQSLIYNHRSFKLKNEAKLLRSEAFERNRFRTIFYIARFSICRLIERMEKMFKKNF